MDSESSSTRRIQSIEMTSIENQITDDANDAGELETPMDMHENELRGGFVAPLEVESASHLGETTQAGNCCYFRLANMKRKHLISFLVIAGVGFVMLVVMLPCPSRTFILINMVFCQSIFRCDRIRQEGFVTGPIL